MFFWNWTINWTFWVYLYYTHIHAYSPTTLASLQFFLNSAAILCLLSWNFRKELEVTAKSPWEICTSFSVFNICCCVYLLCTSYYHFVYLCIFFSFAICFSTFAFVFANIDGLHFTLFPSLCFSAFIYNSMIHCRCIFFLSFHSFCFLLHLNSNLHLCLILSKSLICNCFKGWVIFRFVVLPPLLPLHSSSSRAYTICTWELLFAVSKFEFVDCISSDSGSLIDILCFSSKSLVLFKSFVDVHWDIRSVGRTFLKGLVSSMPAHHCEDITRSWLQLTL